MKKIITIPILSYVEAKRNFIKDIYFSNIYDSNKKFNDHIGLSYVFMSNGIYIYIILKIPKNGF